MQSLQELFSEITDLGEVLWRGSALYKYHLTVESKDSYKGQIKTN